MAAARQPKLLAQWPSARPSPDLVVAHIGFGVPLTGIAVNLTAANPACRKCCIYKDLPKNAIGLVPRGFYGW